MGPDPRGPLDLPAPSDVFTAAEISRAESYSRWARVWSWCGLAVSLVVLVGVAWSGRARRLVVPRRGRWWVRAVLAVLTVSVLVRLATLPFAVAGQVHRRRNGLSNQPWSSFLLDLVTGLALSVAVSTLVVLVVMGTARRWRRAWPVVAGTSLGALVLLGSFGYPILVEPLFNSFESLPDGDLRTQVLALADVQWVNPQSLVFVDGIDGNKYGFAILAPNALIRLGLDKTWLKPGEQVNVTGFLAVGAQLIDGKPAPCPSDNASLGCATFTNGAVHASGRSITSDDGRNLFDRQAAQKALQQQSQR